MFRNPWLFRLVVFVDEKWNVLLGGRKVQKHRSFSALSENYLQKTRLDLNKLPQALL
jgi:hypothetical protein